LINILTRILSGQLEIVKIFPLTQNYPNPFNPITILTFDLPKNSQLTLKVYNILGAEVAALVFKKLPAGYYRQEWDGSNVAGRIYLLETGGCVKTGKMVLMK